MVKDKFISVLSKLRMEELVQIVHITLSRQKENKFKELSKYYDIKTFIKYLEENKKILNKTQNPNLELCLEEILELKYGELSFNSFFIFCREKGISELLLMKEFFRFTFEINSDKEIFFNWLYECNFDEKRFLLDLEYFKKLRPEIYALEIYRKTSDLELIIDDNDMYLTKKISINDYMEVIELLDFLSEDKTESEKIMINKIREIFI